MHATKEVVMAFLTGGGVVFVGFWFFWRHQAWVQRGMRVPK